MSNITPDIAQDQTVLKRLQPGVAVIVSEPKHDNSPIFTDSKGMLW